MFEHLGWFREYFVDGKYIGTVRCEKDREVIGYEGRITETTSAAIVLEGGKKIKAGTVVSHRLYPLCGKRIKQGIVNK